VSGAGEVAGLAQVKWQSFPASPPRSSVCGVVLEFTPEVPGAEAEQQASAVGVWAFADHGVGRVFPQRGRRFESGEATLAATSRTSPGCSFARARRAAR